MTLYTAERRAEEIHFRQLDKHDLSPIRYERVSSSTGKPVEWKDIVKGYEIEPDKFVVLEPGGPRRRRTSRRRRRIDIQDFVPADQIDPAFFETPYYVVPQKRATKAYVLLREALEKKDAVAIATFVLRTREHLCRAHAGRGRDHARGAALRPRAAARRRTCRCRAQGRLDRRRELAMAEQLIDGMMTDWEPAKYRDHFYADVMKMIEEKAKTGTFKPKVGKERGEVASDVVDLLELLKKSVARRAATQRREGAHGAHAREARPQEGDPTHAQEDRGCVISDPDAKTRPDVRIGISGWRYEPWRGVFYPKGLAQKSELHFASRMMRTVEINGSFYSLQRPSSYLAWYHETPDDFLFAVKGGRFISHYKKLHDCAQPLANFFASGPLALEDKLGPILWQLPPQLPLDEQRLEDFFGILPRTTAEAAELASKHDERLEHGAYLEIKGDRRLRYALEVRHETYDDPAFIRLLRKHDVALVVADTAGKFPYLEDVTSDFVYARLHGAKKLYVSGYDRAVARSLGGARRGVARRRPAR